MLKWFMSLTDEQIEHFIDIRHHITNHTKAEILDSDHVDFKYIFGVGFSVLMIWWEDCNHDRVLMKLKYADEIEDRKEIFGSEPEPNPAYPIELSRYMKNA
jgi:hypothetical protein